MTTTVLRYQAKPERAEENQQLIEAVFAELDKGELDGFTYKVFRLEDGVSFSTCGSSTTSPTPIRCGSCRRSKRSWLTSPTAATPRR
jgi:hypothetical protein